jgi:hypothetical protein
MTNNRIRYEIFFLAMDGPLLIVSSILFMDQTSPSTSSLTCSSFGSLIKRAGSARLVAALCRSNYTHVACIQACNSSIMCVSTCKPCQASVQNLSLSTEAIAS